LTTVLFVDVAGSTERLSELGDRHWRELLDRFEETVRATLVAHRGDLVSRSGDSVLATFDGPARAIRCAWDIRDTLRRTGLNVRCGLHTGEVSHRNGDVAGIAVHIGARVSSVAQPGEVLVTRTVRDLVAGSGIAFADRGEHALKGVSDRGRFTPRAADAPRAYVTADFAKATAPGHPSPRARACNGPGRGGGCRGAARTRSRSGAA
jgi:class 3 adenylate cyclase